MHKTFIISVLFITLFFSKLYSQKNVQTTDTSFTFAYISPFEVIVTAQRMNLPLKENSAAISVIGDKFLRTMPRTISVDEALKFVPGVRIDNQANGSRVHMSIRGQGILSEHGIRGIKILQDDLPINDPTGFAPDLYDIDWENVGKIEVLRGSTASLYGGSSSAGIVNIITKNGDNKLFGSELYSSFGSNSFWKLYANANGSNHDLNYSFSLSRMGGDGYRIHSAYHSNNIYGKVNFNISDNVNLKQIFSYSNYFNENPEGLNLAQVNINPRLPNDDAIPMDEFQQTKRLTIGGVSDIKFTHNQNLKLTAYYRTTEYSEPGSKYIWHRKYGTPGGSFQYNFIMNHGIIKNNINIGSDFQWQSINAYTVNNLSSAIEGSTLLSNENIDQSGIGFFIIDQLEISSKLNFMLSLRYDKMNNKLVDLLQDSVDLSGEANFKRLTGRVGVVYSPLNMLNIYANWGEGFLPPATEELASNPINPGGFNQNLEPSISNSYELGLRSSPFNEMYTDLSFFYMTTQRDFDRYRILPDRPLETFYRNSGSSRRFGLESFFVFQLFQNLLLQTAYTYSNFKYTAPDSIKNNWLPNSPKHQFYFDAEYKFFNDFSIGFSTEVQSKWFIYTDNQKIFQDGFKLFNVKAQYQFKFENLSAEVGFFVKNLFGESYIAFTEPDPDGNCYQPGPGREFFTSLRLKF